MEERIYLGILFDYYGVLLTDKQRMYFEDYYFNNLSLSEISFNNNISRNAIHKQIKDVNEKLKQYEKKLKLYEKSKNIDRILNQIENKEIIEKIKEWI